MSEFVDSPIGSEWIKTGIPDVGPGTYNGEDCPPFDSYKRTPSPNAVKEKTYDGRVPKPSGQADHFD